MARRMLVELGSCVLEAWVSASDVAQAGSGIATAVHLKHFGNSEGVVVFLRCSDWHCDR